MTVLLNRSLDGNTTAISGKFTNIKAMISKVRGLISSNTAALHLENINAYGVWVEISTLVT